MSQISSTCRILMWLVLLIPVISAAERQVCSASCRSFAEFNSRNAYGVAGLDGRIIDSCRPDQPLVPASILKIATVSAALSILGPDFRFRTEFFTDAQDNLYIKGFGDPTLISEEVSGIAAQLYQRGLRRVRTLYVDASSFALETQVPGQEDSNNPYDAPIGPLSVNFNSVSLVKDAAGQVVSGEPLTPTLPIMEELAKAQPAGRMRLNICTGHCDADKRMARYAGELFRAQLQAQGVTVGNMGGLRSVPAGGAHLVYGHESTQTLTAVSESTLRYSSNFMANLIFLACGAKKFGYPATWNKGAKAVHEALEHQLGKTEAAAIVQVEGSGLSRDNRVTARAMLQLLQVFRPHAGLLRKEQGVALKTGTLTGVYNYAGYLPDGKAFVILLNQQANNRGAVLRQLRQQYVQSAASSARAPSP